jgi:2-amino-4-hydroxy-6-hydroxymethyldihydropteridine diphosphokinase
MGNLKSVETVYISLGTNLGNRCENLKSAAGSLPPQVRPKAYSGIYKTPPWGYTDQPDFLNQVIQAQTELPASDLLDYLKNIEVDLGRQATFRYGPRLIDLDILFYGEQVIESSKLVIPHPRLHERAFVLVPLVDLTPGLRHPILKRTIQELLEDIDTSGIALYHGCKP